MIRIQMFTTWLRTAAMATTLLAAASVGAVAGPDPYRLSVQDKVRIRIVEWRAGKGEYNDWTALNAEYAVNPAGALSLPLMGEVPVAGKTTAQVAAIISETLQRKVNLVAAPETSVEIVQYRPIYVLGAVDRPGEYAYRPDLTVLMAVSIAGGLYRGAVGAELRLERDRFAALGAADAARLELHRALIRRARLEAELDNASTITPPPELAGQADLGSLMGEETGIMRARADALKAQLAALNEIKNLYSQEVQSLYSQRSTHERQVVLARQELKGVSGLVEKGLAVNAREFSLERIVADREGKIMDLEAAALRAKQESRKAEGDANDLQKDRRTKIALELRETRAAIEQLDSKMRLANALVAEASSAAMAMAEAATGDPKYTYALVRKLDGAPKEMVVDENASILPGDVVRVYLAGPTLQPSALSAGLRSTPRNLAANPPARRP